MCRDKLHCFCSAYHATEIVASEKLECIGDQMSARNPDQSEPVKLPKPGSPVRGSQSGQPIMVLFDLIGRRWSMGVLWNLSDQNRTFRALQERCGSASPSVLNTRLKELRAAGLIYKASDGYALTEDGRALFDRLEPLGEWAADWTSKLE